MAAPVVALACDSATMSWAVWNNVPVTFLAWSYVSAVADAGGSPILLPPVPDAVEDVIDRVDALVLTGGTDVDPYRYSAERERLTLPPDEARDSTDLAALESAQKRGIPILAICRGMAILAVSRNGTLHQHLPEHSPNPPGRFRSQSIRVDPGSRLGSVLGSSAVVSCHHHQGVDRIGDGLVATAWSEDGVIEGIEDPSHPFLIGIQSHPEQGGDAAALFTALVDAARSA